MQLNENHLTLFTSNYVIILNFKLSLLTVSILVMWRSEEITVETDTGNTRYAVRLTCHYTFKYYLSCLFFSVG